MRSLRRDGDMIVAQVKGTRAYRVRLWSEAGELAYSCTCPLGEDGEFCKHCVAAGLAWLADWDHSDDAASGDNVRAYLSGLTANELVDIIMARAGEDEDFYQRLVLRSAKSRKQHGAIDLKVWKRAFDDAVECGRYVEYGEAGGYVTGIEEVIDSVEELLADGEAGAVIALAEHGLEAVEDVIENVDDSDGEMGRLLGRLQELHLAACRKSPPDPEALVKRLFEWELLGQWDVFHNAASTYAEILGERGLAAYRRLAEAEWKKVPALEPGSKADRYGKRFNITSIMETLARQSGDVDALIEVKRRDLSLPYAFLQIAMLCKDTGRAGEALDWAERGWRAFNGTQVDDRLREFLADAYQDRGRHREAMTLAWDGFAESPHLASYQSLHRHAKRAGDWSSWREKALICIRERIAAASRGVQQRPANLLWAPARSDRSLLVEIFLWERKPDDAWREAKEGGCSQGLWLKLAGKREKTHPRDALGVYRDRVARLLTQTGNRIYREAMQFLRKIHALFAAAGEAEKFRAYLTELRATHHRKRNFIKLLDQERW